MLTKEDLQAIREIVEGTIDRRVPGIVEETIDRRVPGIVETESCRQMNIIVEGAILPQLKALAEGQKLLLETLAPKSRVETLEEEIALLKSVLRIHSNEIAELKKAQ